MVFAEKALRKQHLFHLIEDGRKTHYYLNCDRSRSGGGN
jgi:hypothetical protein